MVCDNCIDIFKDQFINSNVILNYTYLNPDKVLKCHINGVTFKGTYVKCLHCKEPSIIFDAYDENNVRIGGTDYCMFDVPQLDVETDDEFYHAVFQSEDLLAYGNVVLEILGGNPPNNGSDTTF